MGDAIQERRRNPWFALAGQVAGQAARQAAREAARQAFREGRAPIDRPPPSMAPPSKRRRGTINYAGKRGRYQTVKREPFDRKEIRNNDTNRNFATGITAGTGEVLLLNGIGQGDGESERSGRVIKPLAVITRFMYNGAAATDEVSLRCLLVQDRMPDGSAITCSEVLNDVYPFGLINFDNLTRFNVLYDKTVRCAPIDNSVRAKQTWEFACPMTGCGNSFYSDAGSTISSLVKGTFYLLLVPDSSVPVNSLYAYSRLTYVDL